LLAATVPERVHSLVWIEPNPRFAWAPDYPWGRTPADMEAELLDIEQWGTRAYARAFLQDEAARGNALPDSMAAHFAKASRNACTPDVALELSKIWYETDVRSVLPAVQVPTSIQTYPGRSGDDFARSRYVASLIPGAELRELPGEGIWSEQELVAGAEALRLFAGVDRAPIELDTILSTVLFTDIVGSTEMQASLSDHGWKGLVERHHAVVREALGRWRGIENDTAGDGFYATFDGPARAIRCAQEIGAKVRGLGMEIRAGVHTGECELIDNKVGGITVTIGARVASKAGASEVLISQTVKDLVAGSGLSFEDAGEHELKGVPDRWHLYRVVA
jgi:class 3 adenylate cyclase